MTAFDITNLNDGRTVDLGAHLDGSWGPAGLVGLDPGASHVFDAAGGEVCTFVIEGSGEVSMDGFVESIGTGMAFTLVAGSKATVTAAQPMRLFTATLPVEERP